MQKTQITLRQCLPVLCFFPPFLRLAFCFSRIPSRHLSMLHVPVACRCATCLAHRAVCILQDAVLFLSHRRCASSEKDEPWKMRTLRRCAVKGACCATCHRSPQLCGTGDIRTTESPVRRKRPLANASLVVSRVREEMVRQPRLTTNEEHLRFPADGLKSRRAVSDLAE